MEINKIPGFFLNTILKKKNNIFIFITYEPGVN
jgi:hypothetical protein